MRKKKEKVNTTFRSLKKLLGRYKYIYLIVILLCVITAVITSLSPYLIGLITTSIFNSITKGLSINSKYIFTILIICSVLYIISAIFMYLKSYLSSIIGIKISYNLREKFIEKINHIDIKKLDSMKKGDLISRVTNDITTLEDSISEIIPGVIYNIVLMIGTLIMMFYISFTLSIISVLIIPVSIIVLSLFVKKIQKYFDLNQKQLGEINSFIEQSITNQNVISSFNKEKYYNEEFENVNDELYIYTFKSTLYSSCAGPIMSFLSNFNYILVIGIGAFNVIKGSLQIGGVQAFIGYIKSFTRTVTDMANSLLNIQLSFASAKRIFEILDIENEVEGEIKELTLKDSIIFKDVCFSYKKDTPILNNLNLTIKKGQQIAIVGTTGAGKTTLINLLMRFYDIDSGSITIDNKNINELNKDTLRSKIGMVLQNTWVFEGNIKENLLFDKVLTEDSFEKLIEDSKIRHLISSLPGGINYKINEEASNISDGEKQLLTIARALAYNPEVLILDEATSNVDSRLEYILNASMKKLMKNRTCLIIAHRLSTIVEADKIVVLENGSIIEEGTHSYLLAKKGAYYNLYNSQFGLIDE